MYDSLQTMALMLFLADERRRIHKPRVFRDRTQPLDSLDDDDLIRRYRLPRQCIIELIDLLHNDLQHPSMRSNALSVSTQVLVALQFYATGTMQRVTGDVHGVSQPSVSRCVTAVSSALTRHSAHYIHFPTTEPQQRTIISNFHEIAGFPNVLGCIDGTQIPILAPHTNENTFVCRKGFHSINVQAICDAKLRFLSVTAKYPGSSHDAFVWKNSSVYHHITQQGTAVPGWLLGDSGYPLSPFLLTPVSNPTTPAELLYNKKHCQTRNTIERTFGLLKMRFRCLHRTGGCLQSPPSTCTKIITACTVLHNMCIDNSVPQPDDVDEDEQRDDNDADTDTASADNNGESSSSSSNNGGAQVRQRLIARRFSCP